MGVPRPSPGSRTSTSPRRQTAASAPRVSSPSRTPASFVPTTNPGWERTHIPSVVTVGDRVLLHLPVRWHVEEPPLDPLEPALDARPRLEPRRVEAVGWCELDGEAHAGGDLDGL